MKIEKLNSQTLAIIERLSSYVNLDEDLPNCKNEKEL